MHLLVVEDDTAIAGALRRALQRELHVVDVAASGPEGWERAESGAYDAIILDLMLPGMDGLEVARRLRADGVATPILMLTARDALPDRLRGFDVGADDYLTKPFALEELLARLRAITRRSGAPPEDDTLVVGDLVLDRRSREVHRAGQLVTLAPKEYALLEYLMRHPGQVLTRSQILERVWDYDFEAFTNVVDASIRRLRRAVDDGHEHSLIHTLRHVGYKIQA
jgi:DNA-binding response OmpR family regulator